MIVWCYPIVFWGLVACLLVKLVQLCLADQGPRWLPLIGAGIALIPIQGIPLGRWMHGVTAGFSIPLFALMLNSLWAALTRRQLLSNSACQAMCVSGVVFGVALYPMAIGLGSFDPYVLGWSSVGLSVVLVVVTSVLVWRENAFGYVLLASAAAWQIGLLESTNAWDYVVDPVYFLISCCALAVFAVRAIFDGKHRSGHVEIPTTVESVQKKAA